MQKLRDNKRREMYPDIALVKTNECSQQVQKFHCRKGIADEWKISGIGIFLDKRRLVDGYRLKNRQIAYQQAEALEPKAACQCPDSSDQEEYS